MSISLYDPIYPFEGCELTSSELSRATQRALKFVYQNSFLALSNKEPITVSFNVSEQDRFKLVKTISTR